VSIKIVIALVARNAVPEIDIRFVPYLEVPLRYFVDAVTIDQVLRDYRWTGVPYSSADPGSKRYTGWSEHGEDYVEPHVVGEDGYAYLRLYEMTGNTK
jgi:hypothetical protein